MHFISKLKRITLVIGDIIILYLALYLTLWIRYLEPVSRELWNKHWLPFMGVFVIWIIIFFINKLYELRGARNNIKFYGALLNSMVWCAALGFVFFYITTTGISPKTILIMDVVIFGILLSMWRHLFNKIISSEKLIENIIIVGLSNDSLKLAEEINSQQQMGFKITAIVSLEESGEQGLDESEVEIIEGDKNLKEYIKQNKIKTIIVAADVKSYPPIINELYKSLDLQITILDLPTFAEKFTEKILVNTIGQMWFLENIKESNKRMYELNKRMMDIGLSFILLIITSLFLPFVYIFIKAGSKGPGFFMQQRTGKHNKKFMAVKFRSMYINSEKNGPQWARKDDPRVTKIGKFLRKSRIDEIPQLINVFRGEMSFVGPRPERPEFIKQLKEKIPFYEARLLVKPGITGWAQINFPYGASEEDALEKLQYDLYYIKNRSFILDLSIILKTIKTVLSGGGR